MNDFHDLFTLLTKKGQVKIRLYRQILQGSGSNYGEKYIIGQEQG